MSTLLAATGDLSIFGKDPIGIIVLKIVAILVILLVYVLFDIWFERRVVSWMQMRIGPNRVGPQGMLQSLMDALKLLFKPLQVVDFPVSVLFVVAVASIGIYGIVLAGWSSGSTYALLGGIRSSAQMISYEIPMGLSFVAVFLYAGSASTSQIISAQQHIWYVVLLLPSFLIYVTAMVGETNRAPFDLPEAESELVGGFHTEYSSMKFAAFFLAEYINMVTVSAVATTLFLGGWRAPWPISLWDGANNGWLGILWFFLKITMFQFMFIWLRGTLARFRYDQFMKFGWKVLLPASIAWIMVVSTARGLRNNLEWNTTSMLTKIGLPVALLLLLWTIVDEIRSRRQKPAAQPVPPYDAFAGGHPVPPLPGQEFGARPIDYLLKDQAKKQEVTGA